MTDTVGEFFAELDTGLPMPEVGTMPAVLAAAIVGAWAELGNLTKAHEVKFGTTSYAYSDLGDLLEMARPVLARHGLALLQPIAREAGETHVTIETWLLHVSGTFLRWRFCVAAAGKPQEIGSAVTYGRRYSATASLGVASGVGADDDDGQAAAKAQASAPLPDVTPPRHTRKVADTPEQRLTRHAMALFAELGLSDRDDRLAVTSTILGREVESWSDTSSIEKRRVVDELLVRRDEAQHQDGVAAAWDIGADDAEA